MGLRKEYLDFILKNCSPFKSKMLELGNQLVKDEKRTGKEFFGSMGCLHISMDRNGKNGSVVHDFNNTVFGWDNYFDIVLNSGFSCCVSKYETCYMNIYNMCKPGGVMIHILPAPGSNWKTNHFVNKAFFEKMSQQFNCEIVECKTFAGIHGDLTMCSMIKNKMIVAKVEKNTKKKKEKKPTEICTDSK